MNLNNYKSKTAKKSLCVILSIIIAFGTLITFTVSYSPLHEWLGIKSMLSAYAANLVDTNGVLAVDEDAMLADEHTINFENNDGSNTVYLFSEPISYTDENGNLKTKDISVEKANYKLKKEGYDYTNGQNDYRINFSKDHNKGIQIAYDDASYSIIPQSIISVEGEEAVAEYLDESFEVFQYSNIYGNGTNLRFYPQLNGVKDEITLNQNINKNKFSFELQTKNCTAKLDENGTISLIDKTGTRIQTFDAPFAYDSKYVEGDNNEHFTDCKYAIEDKNEHSYILTVIVPNEWLTSEKTQYPITIDPTTSHLSQTKDSGVYSKYSTTNFGNEQLCCFGRATDYGSGRVYTRFAIPEDIHVGATINSAYQWERECTGRTATTWVNTFLVNTSWTETGITWKTRSGLNNNIYGTRRNINSNSNDNSSPYWYKFNIKPIVSAWINGTTNNGLAFKSEDEGTSNYNWRAFASRTHSTSSYRPYTVINYTNDTTAPTATVTKSPTGWTSGNVTINISNAKDNTGGAGLHSKPYSFSTTSGSYSWGTASSKAYSNNATVYVSIRDAAGNIKTYTVNINNIDKDGPVYSSVTGNTSAWTNGNITLTVNGASDSKSGLHSSAYSFSSEENIYSWQTSNSKTISSNGTYYIYLRDAVGNITTVTPQHVTKIDKTAPTVPVLTGNENEWNSGEITITATSSDGQSGVAEYSFSSEENTYDWDSSNSITVDENETLYVYAKDNAGNISSVSSTIVKIDNEGPTGGTVSGNSDVWTKNITLTVNNASDELSGLDVAAYSFTSSANEYSWQESNSKSISSNGTVYVSVRDAAGNITLVDEVEVTKLDRTNPTINSVVPTNANGTTTLTINASDSDSGVALYSIDNGETWQDNNSFIFEEGTYNYIYVKVKDSAGNVSSTRYDFYTPQMYIENGKVILYNPNPKCHCPIYYKTGNLLSSQYYTYSEPIIPTGTRINASFIKPNIFGFFTAGSYVSFDVSTTNSFNPGKYEESKTDLTFTYRNVSFEFTRIYDNENHNWFNSVNSNLEFDSDQNVYTVKFINGKSISFIPEEVDLYSNVFNGYQLIVERDENEAIEGYVVKAGNLYYNYGVDGLLDSVSNKYDEHITFSRSFNKIVVSDDEGREYTVNLNLSDKITSIEDAAEGVINYTYSDGKLSEVVDQAGVTLDEYSYNEDGLIIKNKDMSIVYDSNERVIKYEYDSGFCIDYTYNNNTVIYTSSDEKSAVVTYDSRGNVVSSSEDGDTLEYTYNNYDLVTQTKKNGDVTNEYNYDGIRLVSSNEIGGSHTYYYYDTQGRCIKEKTVKDSETNYKYYSYNSMGDVEVVSGLNDGVESIPDAYDETSEDFNVLCEYAYSNNALTQIEDSESATTTSFNYDDYGNVSKVTTVTEEDGTSQCTITDYTYDVLGNMLSQASEGKTTNYTYDAAGRELLRESGDSMQRTVYDNLGRTVQVIDSDDYDETQDDLPNAYSDTTVGHTYVYNDDNQLVSEKNKNGQITQYTYSNVGTLRIKHFDIYDYYYMPNGNCDKVDVNGTTIIDYDYKVTGSGISTSNGRSVNKTTYANGYIDLQKVDKSGTVLQRYHNNSNSLYYSVTPVSNNQFYYVNNDLNYKYTVNSSDNCSSIEKTVQGSNGNQLQFYQVEQDDDIATITESHFGNNYTTVTEENTTSFSYGNNQFELEYSEDVNNEDAILESITDGDSTILSSSYDFSVENEYQKSYNISGISFENIYSNGNIVSDNDNVYTYNSDNELASTTGSINASYTYDSRGNMLTKTANGVTTNFAYTNANWQDQLTSVNGQNLTYDANGNLTSYNGVQYTWSYGKRLTAIADGENAYSYTYDENGIRASKTVNGVTTDFNTMNGTVLAQKTGNDILYFQYSNGTPVGFVHNETQYFYITNLNGDVVGITDDEGNLLATYSYDEWGKLLGITTAEANNTEQYEIAELNPLRYRGYYYDNETGMYYLQSRYYNPDICRFISADDFEYINNDTRLNLNAYAYCVNNPIMYSDPKGNEPDSLNEIVSNILSSIIDLFAKGLEFSINCFVGIIDYITNLNEEINKRLNSETESLHASKTAPLVYAKAPKEKDLGETVVDIVLSLFIMDDLYKGLSATFGADKANDFFGILENVFLLIPSSFKLFFDIFMSLPNEFWDVFSDANESLSSPTEILAILTNVFYFAIFDGAESLPLGHIAAVAGVGLFPAELALLLVGIITDNNLSAKEKYTMFIIDLVATVVADTISIIAVYFEWEGLLKVGSIIVSILIPFVADIIGKSVIRRKRQ